MTNNSHYTIESLAPALKSLLPGLLAFGTPACLIGTDERILAANQSYLDLTGGKVTDVVGMRLHELHFAPDFKVAKPHIDYVSAQRTSTSFSCLWKNAGGLQQWLIVTYFPVLSPNSELLGILTQITQVQDVNGLSDAFIERERMLRRFTDDMGRPLVYLDRDLVVRFMNKPFQVWIGDHDPNVQGRHISRVLPKAAFDFYIPYVHRCLLGNKQSVETLSFALDGPQRHVRLEFLPDVLRDGQVRGVYIFGTDIEEDYQLGKALSLAEQEVRSVMNSIDMPLSKSDRDLRYLYVNRAACDWYGQSEDQIIGTHWADVIGQQQFAEVQPFAERALDGELVTYERYASFPGRAPGRVRVSMFPNRTPTGDVCGLYVVITDIERDHQLKQQIVERERQLQLITDNIGLPISYIGADERVRFYNKTGEEWLGLEKRDIVGKTMQEAFGVETVASVHSYISTALSGQPTTYERLATFPHRGARWVRGHLVPDKRDDGSVAGVYTVLTDIHDDVVMRENLQRKERQLRLFTDNIPEAIVYLDVERRYKFVNIAFLELRGMAREFVIGKTVEEVLGREVADLGAPFQKRALNGEKVVYERLVLTAVAGHRWYRVTAVPDIGPDGNVQGIYVVGTDIHEIRTAHAALESREAELRSAMDSLPYPMAYVDSSQCYRLVNRSLEVLLGKSRDELIGKHLTQVFSPAQFEKNMPVLNRAFRGETISVERLITGADGAERWMTLRYSPRIDVNGQVIGIYTAATDIDELKRTELALRRANWMLTSHIENTPLAVIEWDQDFRVCRWSLKAEKIFGWMESEVLGKHFRDWRFVVEDDVLQFEAATSRQMDSGQPRTTGLNRHYRSDGRIIWCEWYHSSLQDESGKIVSVLSLAQDVSTRVQAEERLVYQATHDDLTNLPNRAMLHDRMRQAIGRARRNGTRIAAMFIDLDRFKEVNDTLGHRIGDELLREIAERLKRALRESDFLVRLSGDEFMVVLEQLSDLDPSRLVAAKILEEIRLPTSIEGHEIHVSASIGISLFPDDANDVETLLKNADMAMYRAKALGKNAFQFFSVELAEQGAALRLLENSLRSALSRNEFELYYQPKIEICTGHIVGAEALLRWHHPTRGLVMPGEFVPIAEEAGLMHEICDWIIDTGFAQVRRWHEKGHQSIRLAINLAAAQFRSTSLIERVKDRLQIEKCRPECIEIEITETSMLRDPSGVGKILIAMRELGLRVAIDDFGTGYSSLSHLKRFPIDTLKIDKTFVSDILHDREDAAIVSAVIAMARALDLEVIAEGVESEAQLAILAAQGCDAYQGFLYSQAVPIAEFDAMLDQNQRLMATQSALSKSV